MKMRVPNPSAEAFVRFLGDMEEVRAECYVLQGKVSRNKLGDLTKRFQGGRRAFDGALTFCQVASIEDGPERYQALLEAAVTGARPGPDALCELLWSVRHAPVRPAARMRLIARAATCSRRVRRHLQASRGGREHEGSPRPPSARRM